MKQQYKLSSGTKLYCDILIMPANTAHWLLFINKDYHYQLVSFGSTENKEKKYKNTFIVRMPNGNGLQNHSWVTSRSFLCEWQGQK